MASIAWSGLTHPGKVRKNNEDSFLGVVFNAQDVQYLGKIGQASLADGDFVFAVSDGMGGENSGEFASKIATERITRTLPKSYKAGAEGPRPDFEKLLHDVVAAIHAELCVMSRYYEECRNMGATLSLAWISPGWLHYVHIGDSRIYTDSGGKFQQITADDTYPGYLRKTGRINEREQRNHPRRNALMKAMGAGNQFVDAQTGVLPWSPGDRLLLCTDGVVDGLWDHRLAEVLANSNSDGTAARELVELAVEESGKDNCTAIVVHL